MKFNDIFSFRKLTYFLAACALAGGLGACQEDPFVNDVPDEGNPGGISFRCADMVEVYKGSDNPASRAVAPKDELERKINTLHVFFFNQATGELMSTTNYDNFQAYMKKDNAFLKIPTPPEGQSLFEGGDDVEVRIVAIANIDATDEATSASADANSFYTRYSQTGKISKESREKGAPVHEIKNYSDIRQWVYYPRLRIDESTGLGNIRELPAAGMPMIGELTNVKLNEQKPYMVNMTALMAKIHVSVRLNPDQFTPDGSLPEIAITEVGVMNMPSAVPYVAPTGAKKDGSAASKPADYDDYLAQYDVTNVSMVHPGTERDDAGCAPELHEYTAKIDPPLIVTKNTEPALLSYYTYENIQLPDYNAKRTNGSDAFNGNLEPQYPAGITDADKQRWKSTLAYKNRASALVLKGTFTTHQEVDYEAKFTVFMGQDENTDFMVKRNHRYDNNITIYGMDFFRNSDDGVFNFDGRLNVVSDNPLYLAIVNERKVDAHATALPLSVWLMMWEDANNHTEGHPDINWRSEVTLSIQNPEVNNWIRMGEVIPRSVMEGNNWKSGTGAEPYFYTDLVTNTLRESGKTRTITSADGSRSRVYFYIDENVPSSNDDPNYGDRFATVDINYKRFAKETGELVEERNYTLDIEQRALLKVSGTHSSGNNVPTTWMEYYEEYLDHNDPLDKHEMPGEYYTGLKWWRVDGVNMRNLFGANEHDAIFTKELAFTSTQLAVSNQGGLSSIKLFNDVEPESAFHYCYGKNKRDTSGNAVVGNNKGWYMPGIRELEYALVTYYNSFESIRNSYYWSASAATRTLFGTGDSNNEYARATRVTLNQQTGEPEYAESKNAGEPGRQRRNVHNRIRAFYRVD